MLLFFLKLFFAIAPYSHPFVGVDADIKGTKGDDNLVAHAVLGEAKIAQDYESAGTGATGPNGEELRADDENDPLQGEDTYFAGQPFNTYGDYISMRGKRGADEFLIRTYISGKPDIVAKHVDENDVINWNGNGVAGENNNVHDHWVEYFGKVVIRDYKPGQGDTIRVQGHTVALNSITQKGKHVHIVVQSQQGNGGGAHDEDILGLIVVRRANVDDVEVTFTHTNDGIVETYTEFEELVAKNKKMAEGQEVRDMITEWLLYIIGKNGFRF